MGFYAKDVGLKSLDFWMILSLLQPWLKTHFSSHRSPYDYRPCWYSFRFETEIAYAHSSRLMSIHPPENEWQTNLAGIRTPSLRPARMTTWIKVNEEKGCQPIHHIKMTIKHPWVSRSRMFSLTSGRIKSSLVPEYSNWTFSPKIFEVLPVW